MPLNLSLKLMQHSYPNLNIQVHVNTHMKGSPKTNQIQLDDNTEKPYSRMDTNSSSNNTEDFFLGKICACLGKYPNKLLIYIKINRNQRVGRQWKEKQGRESNGKAINKQKCSENFS